MAKTLENMLDEVRDLLQDSRASSYRYSTARLVRQINTTLQEVYRLRPDAFIAYDTAATAVPEFTESDLAEEIGIEDLFYQSVVFHVVSVTQLSDDEFANDGRAISLMSAFRQQLVGG